MARFTYPAGIYHIYNAETNQVFHAKLTSKQAKEKGKIYLHHSGDSVELETLANGTIVHECGKLDWSYKLTDPT